MFAAIWVTFSLELLAVAGLVLLNGLFVAAEFALVKVRETQLETLVAKGLWRARVVRRLKRNLGMAISATQLGITVVSLGLGWLVEPVVRAAVAPVLALLNLAAAPWLHSVMFFLAFATISFVLIIAGEMVPKAMAIRKTLPVALWVATPLTVFCRVTAPLIWVINHTAQSLLGWLGIPQAGPDGPHSEEELRLVFEAAQKGGASTELGRDLVLNALELRHRVAREVMRPRLELVALNTEASIEECLELAEKSRYSRFPLCRGGDLDKTLGVIHIKDLWALRHKARTAADLVPAARKIIYAPETARLEKLLQLFLDRRLHLAIVVDEYGGTVGMVTLENILEELVGQIQDEFDQEKPLVVKTGAATWQVLGALPLHELAELTGERLREENVSTVSGFVTLRLGGFPREGDTLALGAYDLKVEETEGLRVAQLTLSRRPTSEPPAPGSVSDTVAPT